MQQVPSDLLNLNLSRSACGDIEADILGSSPCTPWPPCLRGGCCDL